MEICPRCGGQFLGCSCFVSDGAVSDKKVKSPNVAKPDHNCKGGNEKQNNLAIEAAVEEILEHGIEFLKKFGEPSSMAFFYTPRKKYCVDRFDFRDKKKAKKLLKRIAKKRRATMIITMANASISKYEGTALDPAYFRREVIFVWGETKYTSFGISQEYSLTKNGLIKLGKKIKWPDGSVGPMTGFMRRKM